MNYESRRRSLLGALAVASLLGLLEVRPARAQNAAPQAAAQALFEEGRRLMTDNSFAAACAKFSESQRLDPTPGTQFNLANCYEKNGQLASAWVTFKGAASAYRASGRTDWEARSRDRAQTLEPKLSKLVVSVKAMGVLPEGLEIVRDGAVVGPAELETPIPVDPGEHAIEAKAPGTRPWSAKVTVGGAADRVTVSVPPLGAETAAEVTASTPETTTPPTSGSSMGTVAIAVTAAGVIGLATGAVTGLVAIGRNNASQASCPGDGACSSREGVSANDEARAFGTVSTVAFVAGGVLAATGVVLYLTAPRRAPPSVGLSVGPSHFGVLGRF